MENVKEGFSKKMVKELASEIMHYADRKGYGLGEVGFNFNTGALDMLMDENEDCMGNASSDVFGCDCEEPERSKHMAAAKKLAREAQRMAFALQDMGVNTFN